MNTTDQPHVDFTAYRIPVLAVPCPTCGAAVGVHCRRPSQHNVMGKGFHDSRGAEVDRLFVLQHGPRATIARDAHGRWVIDPTGLPADDPRVRQAVPPAQLSLPL